MQRNLFNSYISNVDQNKFTNDLTQFVINWINGQGGKAWRVNTSGIPITKVIPGVGTVVIAWRKAKTKGQADIRAIYQGRSIDIEIKSPQDGLTDDQEAFKNDVESAGGQYWLIRNSKEFLDFFTTFKKTIAE